MPKVLLTRPKARSKSNDDLHSLLSNSGINVVDLPMLNFEFPSDTTQLDQALERAAKGEFDIVVMSSPTAIEFLEDRITDLGMKNALVANAQFAVVGPATDLILASVGYKIAFPIPASAGAHQLMALLSERNLSGKRVLLLQSQLGFEVLEHSFTEQGAIVERVTLFLTKGPSIGDSARLLHMLENSSKPDVIAFFSPSAVMYFVRSLAEMSSGLLRDLPALACIGETTAKAVEETLHRRPEIVARKADQQSMAQDIMQYLKLSPIPPHQQT